MRGALVLAIVLAGIVAMPERAAAAPPVVPGLVQDADTDGDGWALCWQRGAGMSFWCPLYPRSTPVAVRTSWWSVAKCAVAIAAFVAGNVVAAYKIRRAGGVWKAARRILKARKGEERAKAIAGLFTDLAGLTGVIEACGGG
jgi:hypothetical protein